MHRPALFLDRDGVINVDHGYVYRREDFEFIDGIFEVCHSAKTHGFWIFVITNQAGIARGKYTVADFESLTAWMQSVFRSHDIEIDKVYFSPFHPIHGIGQYKMDSNCRKPNPGLLQQAATEHAINFSRSILIGDKLTDISAGLAAGVNVRLLLDPTRAEVVTPESGVTAVIDRLSEAIPYFKQSQGESE